MKLVGLHVADRPLGGAIVQDSVREPAKPLRLETVTVEVPDEPVRKVTVDGLAVTLKSPDGTTFTATATKCEREPVVPVAMTE